MKVLFVDDEPNVLKQAKIFLNREDERLETDTADTARKALEMLKGNDYEAVIADYKMSGMNGTDLLREFREIDEKKPFIVLTGKGNEKAAMDALNLGADRYLQKKDDPRAQYEELADIIAHEIEHYRSEERKKFLYALLRHDVRNKAQLIQEYLGLLKETDLNDEQKKYLKGAKETAEGEYELIENIRKLREVKGENIEKVDLSSAIEKALEDKNIKEHDEEIEISYKDPECRVLGGTMLKEAFSQLIDNSISHSNCERIRITSRVSNDKCIVTIEDNGSGIPEDIKDDIFDKAWSGKGKRGSGLGLYLVKKIIEKYEGDIELKDSELGGARFDVYLKKV